MFKCQAIPTLGIFITIETQDVGYFIYKTSFD